MRLPFPTRIPVQKTFLFAAAVFIAQLVQHTGLKFAALFFMYIMLSVIAFNFAGGFSRASGGYIFWFGLLTCILGGIWKVVLGEPADSNLVSADFTLATYVVSMITILGALFISRRFTRTARGLSAVTGAGEINLGYASLGCFIVYWITYFANYILPHGSGSLANIINQINVFLPLCILLGTIHSIRISGGRRSVTLLTVAASAQIFIQGGLISYSKQAMFIPIVCWGVAAASQRYRLRVWQVILLVAFAIYSVTMLAPLSQVARAIIPDTAGQEERLMLSVDLLSHPKVLRAEYLDSMGVVDPSDRAAGFATSWYDSPQGLMDRLNIIRADDRLVTYTLQGHTVGKMRVVYYFLNWIPHFILPHKDEMMPQGTINSGNYYAHEVGGLLSPDDYSTGISFSPSAEAFHMDTWLGIVIVGGFVWTLLFIVVDLICGDVRYYPIGLFSVVAFSHVAPESLIGNLVYFIFFGDLGIVVAILFCSYFAPVIGLLLSGPQEPRIGRLQPLQVSTSEA